MRKLKRVDAPFSRADGTRFLVETFVAGRPFKGRVAPDGMAERGRTQHSTKAVVQP